LYSAVTQPRVLIFCENSSEVFNVAQHIDHCLPPELRKTGIVLHYHGSMSLPYLDGAHKAFIMPGGQCRILVATSGESMGIDFPNVEIVCVTGLPPSLTGQIQMNGWAVHQAMMRGLAVLFYEPWVKEIELTEYEAGDPLDPDRPRKAVLGAHPSDQERAGFISVGLVQGTDCIRRIFAMYLGDMT
ncbi:hypothetical protein C8J56DRAFT_744940, partial [Mycena floridula]